MPSSQSLGSHPTASYKESQNDQCYTIQTGNKGSYLFTKRETRNIYETHQQTTTIKQKPPD